MLTKMLLQSPTAGPMEAKGSGSMVVETTGDGLLYVRESAGMDLVEGRIPVAGYISMSNITSENATAENATTAMVSEAYFGRDMWDTWDAVIGKLPPGCTLAYIHFKFTTHCRLMCFLTLVFCDSFVGKRYQKV